MPPFSIFRYCWSMVFHWPRAFGAITIEQELSQAWSLYRKLECFLNFHIWFFPPENNDKIFQKVKKKTYFWVFLGSLKKMRIFPKNIALLDFCTSQIMTYAKKKKKKKQKKKQTLTSRSWVNTLVMYRWMSQQIN